MASALTVNGGIYISFSFQLTKIRISEEKTKRKSAFLFFLVREYLIPQVKDSENENTKQKREIYFAGGK